MSHCLVLAWLIFILKLIIDMEVDEISDKKCQLNSRSCGNMARKDAEECVLLKDLKENFGNLFNSNVVIS